MLYRVDQKRYRLIRLLPRWLVNIEAARVGTDTENYSEVKWRWTAERERRALREHAEWWYENHK